MHPFLYTCNKYDSTYLRAMETGLGGNDLFSLQGNRGQKCRMKKQLSLKISNPTLRSDNW